MDQGPAKDNLKLPGEELLLDRGRRDGECQETEGVEEEGRVQETVRVPALLCSENPPANSYLPRERASGKQM